MLIHSSRLVGGLSEVGVAGFLLIEVVIVGPGQFTFQWCELPVFDFEVTAGNLVVR